MHYQHTIAFGKGKVPAYTVKACGGGDTAPLIVNLDTRAVESESEGILGGARVGKNVPTPTSI
jgi:hypothetical protein